MPLDLLLGDRHLAELDRALDFARVLDDARRGSLDSDDLLRRGRRAAKRYVARQKDRLAAAFRRGEPEDLRHLLCQKLRSLARALELPSRSRCEAPRLNPTPSAEVQELFSRRCRKLALRPVPGARVVASLGDISNDGSRYSWLATDRRDGARGFASARAEVGRSVFLEDCDWAAHHPALAKTPSQPIRTQIVLKGIGPTPFAGNRFSARTSGAFTLMQGERDWKLSHVLAAAGVPVYQPLALISLPYWDWHPHMGWRPLCVYARLPVENLRVSDRMILSVTKRRALVKRLRAKIAALTDQPVRSVTTDDVVRFFVARLGRIAGLFAGGRAFGGRCFFHGTLHLQNVSLLGEMVDFSDCPGVVERGRLRAEYRKSIYPDPKQKFPLELARAKTEAAVFQFLVSCFVLCLSYAVDSAEIPTRREVKALFHRSYREGRAGRRADDAREVLEAARRPLRSSGRSPWVFPRETMGLRA